MADLYLKALTSERRALWAECRLKGLAKDTPQRQRIVEIDALLAAHKANRTASRAPDRRDHVPTYVTRLHITTLSCHFSH